MKSSQSVHNQMRISPGFLIVVSVIIIFIIAGNIYINIANKHYKILTKIHILLSEEYKLDFDTAIKMPDGRSINFLNYIAGPGHKLSNAQLKVVLDLLEKNKPSITGIIESVKFISKDALRGSELESWMFDSDHPEKKHLD